MIPKFRAWDKEKELMGEVVQINFEIDTIEYVAFTDLYVWSNFEKVELMQSTGLQDKNGVEIFEGDIVISNTEQDVEHLCVVEWHEKDLQWQLKAIRKLKGEYIGTLIAQAGVGVFKHCEVIGNIYENKELLNE